MRRVLCHARSGFSYSNQSLIYSRDKSKGPNGEVLATGSNSVVMDMNTLAWVSGKKILGGAKFSMTATIPFQKLPDFRFHRSGQRRRRVSRFVLSTIHSGLGEKGRVSCCLRFPGSDRQLQAGANNNVGSGYWTHALFRSHVLSDRGQEDYRIRLSGCMRSTRTMKHRYPSAGDLQPRLLADACTSFRR